MTIGIDLGTTHCGVAHSQPDTAVEEFSIAQLVNVGEVRDEPLLPSFLYIPTAQEADGAPYAVGYWAQKRGTETLGRLISSAKSWLSYSGVDRTSSLLPLNAPEGVAKLSPVAAESAYLRHIRDAWNEAHPDAPFAQQEIVITVPASFDAVARELTLRAAADAGYPKVTLLEEPQAAFYAWIEHHPDWRQRVTAGDTVLVVDVGGGTTDFTLIAIRDQKGELALERIAVGDHILLGGDNMDLALARLASQKLPNTKLDPLQFQALWQQCRIAKEHLLDPGYDKDDYPVTILGRGSSLIGGTIKTKLTRAEVLAAIVEGFLPLVPSTEVPERGRRSALAEIGLPYAADARITAHLADFLARSGVRPTHVLFNGGVLRAPAIRKRLLEFLKVPALEGENLMHAVARGAAYYGQARSGRGLRIRGGVSRTYYVGIESSLPAVPGFPAPMKALTVAPFGMEEGTQASFSTREFVVAVGQTAEFRFFSSPRHDAGGELLEELPEDLTEMPPMEVTLTGTPGLVRVTLETVVTETGMLELWCVAKDGRRWKLEFNVREKVR
ncbi:MAG: Hsp70 family protein [Acidobacteria bacterium]|nr:Hsp70 family protein [Acidobacteriota bacterium]